MWAAVPEGEERKRTATGKPGLFLMCLPDELFIYICIYLFIFQFSDNVMFVVISKDINVFGNSL